MSRGGTSRWRPVLRVALVWLRWAACGALAAYAARAALHGSVLALTAEDFEWVLTSAVLAVIPPAVRTLRPGTPRTRQSRRSHRRTPVPEGRLPASAR